MKIRAGFFVGVALALLFGCAPAWAGEGSRDKEGEQSRETESGSRLSDMPIPLQVEEVPDRPSLILELGEPFLGTGPLGPEVELPTGAVWRPSLWVFGTHRMAVQTVDNGATRVSEWAHRLDLFANLKLSASDRLLIGLRPLDRDNRFTSVSFEPDGDFRDEFNAVVRTLFFEGDLGEIFPKLDTGDTRMLDIGFSVGRQAVLFQDGILINSGGLGNPDAVSLVRNNLQLPGTSNVRISVFYAWDNVYRDDNRLDPDAQLFGLFTETDFPTTTIDLDLVYLEAGENTDNALFAGIRGVQRIGPFNTTSTLNTSFPMERETPQTSRGTLVFNEISWTPQHTQDFLYLNTFWGIGEFSSAIRGPETGGPLGRTGILFAAVGLGRYGAALGNGADNAVGGSLGYQKFLDRTRKQFIVELGGRKNTNNREDRSGAFAAGLRYQQAVGRHFIARLDAFGAVQEERDPAYGARLEWLTKF
ncbi:MAG: hypothetical protein OXB94_10800 [Nitrospira sp.]|nr:hypothetical protein [Nitrospira sp.]